MISVIVPVYNVSRYLAECLESIIGQTFRDIEIIVVDDGSTDGCDVICEEYGRQDSRIRILHKPNGGLVRARKDGFRLSTGEYVTYVDGDDWIEPTMLEQLYLLLEQEQTDLVMCGHFEDTGAVSREVYHGFGEGKYDKAALNREIYPKMIVNELFFEWGIWPGLCGKLFHRKELEFYQMDVDDRLTMGEDLACVFPYILNAESIYILHECLYHYRQTPSSMVKQVESVETERRRFHILYETVYRSFGRFPNASDMRKQWKEYMLFLMTPRADTLYEGIGNLEYLFPFPKVRKGSRIVLYGMGTYGQRLSRYIQKTGFCELAAQVDRNYVELQRQGFSVIAPDEIAKCEYDFIVAASSFAKTRQAIYQDLTRQYQKEKVQIMDEELVKSGETASAFGLKEYPLYLYGAKSIALGACLAIRQLYPGQQVCGFIVKSLEDNPTTLAGLPVRKLSDVEDKEIHILIATPEDLHEDIISDLHAHGIYHVTCLDSERESLWMEQYFKEIHRFPSLHGVSRKRTTEPRLCVYAAKSSRDKASQIQERLPDWVQTIWVGAALGGSCEAGERDDRGENISQKNRNYCELTALYWMWKNKIKRDPDNADVYYGLFHYRRTLEIREEDLCRFAADEIDVVLPFPMIHEPDIFEHHTRYLKETDWNAMCQALNELYPEYADAFPAILSQPYFYNYNMLIAKADVLDRYCEWLFPILERTEELSVPRGKERSDRYIGYLGENLLTLYFMYHSKELRIAHTGRKMLVQDNTTVEKF